ncbi:leucine-rich repeat domain-containing protein [Zavarzinella formosa]|uniref:hypothetical protein n=1 Tax=Zavarzinella formosa TaxID=360055 RepID=UPI00031B2D45|nr:hypothetical protein [Zavarzinella formosa]
MLRSLLTGLCLFGLSGVSLAQPKKASEPPPELLKAWEDAGASFSWRSRDLSANVFQRKPDDVWCFDFSRSPKSSWASLPSPKQPFAIRFPDDFKDDDLKGISKHQQIVLMDLISTEITDKSMKEIASLKNLSALRIMNLTKITDDGMKELVKSESLTSLFLTGTKVTDVGLKDVGRMKQLTTLWVGSPGPEISDEGLQALVGLEKLTTLQIHSLKITNTGLEHLAKLKQLTTLDGLFFQVTDKGLKHLANLEKLTRLDLFAPEVTDAGIKELAALKQLREINLIGTKATDAGVKELQAALPKAKITK